MYLLDANAFMEANRLYYAFDIAPGFWTWLGDPSLAGQVASIDAVKDEITAGTGDLVDWARSLPAAFWLSDTTDVLAAMTELAAWAADPARQYRQDAVDKFLDSADLRLIAHATAVGATLVTREQPAPESKTKIKIPDVCTAFGVVWTDPLQHLPIAGTSARRMTVGDTSEIPQGFRRRTVRSPNRPSPSNSQILRFPRSDRVFPR